ncbi:hypothetical protein SAMN04487947_0625 [Halogeometricum rufum]|jgi:hypothetical protein|uniref:Uncharacterized protein n=1 Tax=Halogeometricum rufum TaxID=553469 RepID=A0A1I6G600_9EURY|nr:MULTISPECIES: hypothetical protein [Halogeometricum]MUV57603.1 hypothetical protein [Halogeometricum sp. CBA1124]SFR37609.1 hypothetical protein SAMN04487947_0625 [Halogeometricum rufum]
MATETQTGLSGHMRGVTVTTLACLAGIGAAFGSGALVGLGATPVAEAATNQQTLAVLGAFVLAQFPLLRVVGVDVGDFGAKDYLYVVFMTFTLWYISYGIMLTSGVSL